MEHFFQLQQNLCYVPFANEKIFNAPCIFVHQILFQDLGLRFEFFRLQSCLIAPFKDIVSFLSRQNTDDGRIVSFWVTPQSDPCMDVIYILW